MFSGLAAIEHHPARRWTATASFMLQSALVLGAFIYPLLHPTVLPEAFLRRRIFVPMSSGEVHAETTNVGHGSVAPVLHPIIVNSTVTFHPPTVETAGAGLLNALEMGTNLIGDPNPSVINSIIGTGMHPAVRPPTPAHPLIRTSSVMEGLLIHRVQPRYPPIALQTHTQGAVIVSAIIGRDGRIEQAQVIRGQALLNNAALEAVKQWQYRPYYLNGEAIEVETQITVNFVIER
jgi:periplasmic protein TonB